MAASENQTAMASENKQKPLATAKGLDLSDIRSDISKLIYARDHDDGSYAPLLIRFAWHCCGTYDRHSDTGGSNGGTMRFEAEQKDPENAGLGKAIKLLEPIVQKYGHVLSTADIYILAGYVSIEASGGPHIRFRHGRKDFTMEEAIKIHGPTGCPFGSGKENPNGSRLPSADLGPEEEAPKGCPMHQKEAKTIAHIRAVFDRLGFDDNETVALILLGHQYGRCHPENSGYFGAWNSFNPTGWQMDGLGYFAVYNQMINSYYEVPGKQSGKRQYVNGRMGNDFMMLIADMALWWDPTFQKIVKAYNRDRRGFKSDAIKAWTQLTELGCKSLHEEITPRPAGRSSMY